MPQIYALLAALLFVFATTAFAQEISQCCNVLEHVEDKDRIKPEAARRALMKLKSLRVISSNEDDPIYVDLKTAEIQWIDDTSIRIGRFIVCDLKTNTWQMSISNSNANFFAMANGTFKRLANGRWRAVRTGGMIT